MSTIEIAVSPRTKDSSAMIHILIEKTEYIFLSCGNTVNVITGHALIRHRRKSLGKCFWEIADIGTHYKKNSMVLMEYAKRVQEMGKVVA